MDKEALKRRIESLMSVAAEKAADNAGTPSGGFYDGMWLAYSIVKEEIFVKTPGMIG